MFARPLRPLLLLAACATGDPDVSTGAVTAVPTLPPGPTNPAGSGDESEDTGDDPTTGASAGPTAPDPSTDPSTDPATDPWTTDPDPATSDPPPTTDPATSGPETTAPASASDATTDVPDPECGPCDAPPGPCHTAECVAGVCEYPFAADGTDCDDGDPCTEQDACDGNGGCGGAPIACEAPNATGGACTNGACQGFTCVAPWDNCDDNWENGCEVPTGVANQCDINGLTTSGCWTAYCGSSNSANAENFGTYYCMDCANCHEPVEGQWQWCNHTSGSFYPPEAGNCSAASQDVVCPQQ